MFAFSLVTLFRATTYWWRRTRVLRHQYGESPSNKQKGLIAQHTGEDTSQQQKDTQLQVVKEIYNKVPTYDEPNKIVVKQLQGIKLYKRRSV